MQKADLSNLGDLYLMNIETGEKVPWDGIVEISDDKTDNEIYSNTVAILHETEDSEPYVLIPPELADKLNEAAVAMCSTGKKIPESIIAMIKEQEKFGKSLQEGLMNAFKDDKTPNPIYIPKHIQHRKKGRR